MAEGNRSRTYRETVDVPTGFEAGRTTGCACLPKSPMTRVGIGGAQSSSCQLLSTRSTRPYAYGEYSQRVEELQNLKSRVCADSDASRKWVRFHGAVLLHEAFHRPGERAYAVAVVVEIATIW